MVVVSTISSKKGCTTAELSLLESIIRMLSLDWEVQVSHCFFVSLFLRALEIVRFWWSVLL
ncbi:hypothetical protein A2U01_0062718, partial [Trifolium medium]|nr:hypothetical protein [Trifolium medium]